MEEGCRSPALHSFIQHKFVNDPEELKLYYLTLGKRFVNENQQQHLLDIKWCPGADCVYSIRNPVLDEPDVVCPNGHHWCFICRQEAHKPVSC